MAATGYTPIQLYYSTTAAAVPTAGNLASGELAINITDGKLYYKSNAGVVTLLAGATAGPAGGSNTQVQFNSSGALAGSANLTFNGTTLTANALTVTNAVTLSGGTANGVAYLNGSKVVTSGSALVFDGTNLSTTGNITLANTKILCSDATSSYIGIAGGTSLSPSQGAAIYMYGNTNAGTGGMYLQTGNVSGADMVFAPRDTEGMRLTSTGLGIGTTSPSQKLDVTTNSNSGTAVQLSLRNTSNGTNVSAGIAFGFNTVSADPDVLATIYGLVTDRTTRNGALTFSTAASGTLAERARIDSAGNFGLGGTPNAYGSTTTLTISGTTYAEVDFESGSTLVGYVASSASALELTTAGAYPLVFKTNSTERARIDSAGNFMVGTTSGTVRLTLKADATSASCLIMQNSAGTQATRIGPEGVGTSADTGLYSGGYVRTYVNGNTSTPSTLVDTSGNFLVGTTSVTTGVSGTETTLIVKGNSAGKSASLVLQNNTGTGIGYLGVGETTGITYLSAKSNHPLVFQTNDTERARFSTTGYFSIGTTNNMNVLNLIGQSNGGGISWGNYMNVFSEYSSGAAYISSNYYPTYGASGYKTTLTATFGAAGISVSGTGGASNGGLITFLVDPATSKTADAAFTPTEVGQFTSDGSFIVGDSSARSGYGHKISATRNGATGGTASNIASVTRGGAYASPYTSASDPGFDWQFGKGAQSGTTTTFEWGTSGGGGTVLMGLTSGGNLTISGALSKGSGSFVIDHPLPQLEETHHLVHSFIEGPQADLIYRGRVNLVNGRAEVNIDTASTMTDGTFVLLCRDVQCYTSNESDWIHVRGFVTGNILTIEAQDPTATSSISWMVIGERQDKHMLKTEWTDDTGKIIVEPTKASRLYDPTKDPMNPECPDYDPTLKPLM